MKKISYPLFFITCFLLLSLTACGFRLQGEANLAPPLHRLYLQTNDPYGYLARYLQQYLKMSHVILVANPAEATTILAILQNQTWQELLSVSSTQQTRQYRLKALVVFQITDAKGHPLVIPQTLIETRAITVQASQILGSSNETNMVNQQMWRSIAYAIMNRISSKEITRTLNHAFSTPSSDHKT